MKTGSLIKLTALLLILASCGGRHYRMPTSSMENTLMVGETFYVSEASTFQRNDIAVFNIYGDNYNKPLDDNGKFEKEWMKWTSRIIALSGDSVRINRGDVFVNENRIPPPPTSLADYEVTSTVPIDDFPNEERYPSVVIRQTGNIVTYHVFLTEEQARNYESRQPAILSVEKKVEETMGNIVTPLATNCGSCPWSIDNYGPVKIPSPGDTITVDETNSLLYQNVPGIKPGKQVVTEKFYFMMGDNRHGAMDSRYIGFISHSKMHGIVK